MSKRISLRLSDEQMRFVDEVVHSGELPSRTAVVTRALERERQRIRAAHDGEILASAGTGSDLTALADYVARLPQPLD
jgi:Arc/MetJ-type ribon-helix-helix transcriptional regulator